MLKNLLVFVVVFVLLGGVLLNAQVSQVAPAPTAAPAAADTDVSVASSGEAGEEGANEVSMDDVTKMTSEELIAYLASLDSESFGAFIVKVIVSGDRYLARRVVSAANQVIADSDSEKTAVLIDSVNKHGEGIVVVQDLTIRVIAPVINSLLKKFDVPSLVEDNVQLPPVDPSYSAGATR